MFDNPRGGLGYAAEYQSSALPWVTASIAPAAGSPVRWDFPKVTRFITVLNLGAANLGFGFTRAGVASTNNKYIVAAGQSITLELRVKELWVQGENGTPAYSLCAGLTSIDRSMMPVLTGTLPDGSAGWTGVG